MRLLLILLPILFAGCGRTNDLRQVRGELPWADARAISYDTAHRHGLMVRYVGPSRSNGDHFSDRTWLLLKDSYHTVSPGKMVVYNAGTHEVFHQVIDGSPDGWLVQGMANPYPDTITVTEDNYIGTYVGRFDAEERH